MKKLFVIAKKEFAALFHSWVGVVTGVLFFLMTGIFFLVLVLTYNKLSMDPRAFGLSSLANINQTQYIFGSFFLNASFILNFLVPILTMRVFAEEKKQETLELLFTYPVSDFEIVGGKLLGLVGFFMTLLLPITGYFLIFHLIGGEIDWGPALSGLFGFWLLGISYLTAGLFISTLTRSPVMSALGTFGLLVLFWMLEIIKTTGQGLGLVVLEALSPLSHYRNFTYGILDLRDLVYFGFFFAYFLFLALRSIETRNWKNV